MSTHPRKHSDAIQIAADILKEAAKPRQSASVKEACERRALPLSPRKRVVGTKVEKAKPLSGLPREVKE